MSWPCHRGLALEYAEARVAPLLVGVALAGLLNGTLVVRSALAI